MRKLNLVNENLYYVDNPKVQNNTFIGRTPDTDRIPTYEESKDKLPSPVWEGHKEINDLYDYTWKIGFGNLSNPNPETKFVSSFIDTAFNGFLFMWDSSFIVQFGKYGSKVFNFQKTLDNFYSNQHRDGFICREICETRPGEQFSRDDPIATGPNILPWAEWEYYLQTGDKNRLCEVFDPLCAYHEWLRLNHTWRDGSYWSTGLGCGMDNQTRLPKGYNAKCSNGHMIWLDACLQQILSAKIIVEIGKIIGRDDETDDFKREIKNLSALVNKKMWSEKDSYYYDLWYNEDKCEDEFSFIKSVGAYWALLADIVPDDRIKAFVDHLDNEKEFKRHHRVPSLSADDPNYDAGGGYWLGSIWAPTNYMVLKGLRKKHFDSLAFDIGLNHFTNILEVFKETGTIWECYAPESYSRGNRSKDKFVGWTGLVPIAVLFEFVFGIEPFAQENKVVWHINLNERHGVERYPLKDGVADLICEEAKPGNAPKITIKSDFPVEVEAIFEGKTYKFTNK